MEIFLHEGAFTHDLLPALKRDPFFWPQTRLDLTVNIAQYIKDAGIVN